MSRRQALVSWFMMTHRPCLLAVSVCLGIAGGADAELATQAVDATGIRAGFFVHLSSGDGQQTAALRVNEHVQVHGLDRSPERVAEARRYLQSAGVYGDIAVDHLEGDSLPYIDNLVNLLVAEDDCGITRDEIFRVLVPGGKAYLKQGDEWVTLVKTVPDDIDEWTHYLYDSRGNAVAHDDRVGPPRHLQWIGSPRWSRHHDRMASMSAMVSSGGRVFYIMDEGSRISIQMPAKWMLIARDAFNGSILWKQPIPEWHDHLWPLKSGPTHLARRLVATPDRVFVTLGFKAPVTVLDAVTGEVLTTYKATDSTEELIHEGNVLFSLVNRGENALDSYAPQLNVGDQGRVNQDFRWNELPRQIVATRVTDGERLWSRTSLVVPLTLAADHERVLYHDGARLVCLDRDNGKPLWTAAEVDRRERITFNFGPRLLIHDDVVLFAGGDRTMRAFKITTGEQIWTAPHAQSGYQSPEDLIVAGGLVWNAPTTRTQDSGLFQGRDPNTGEVKIEFPPDVNTYWFHHRCYITKATDNYLLPSRTGIEFVDPATKHWDINHWVRGGCLYGVMPCNGLVYAPPHNCACYPEAKIYGMNALAPASPSRAVPVELDHAARFQQGPASGQPIDETAGPTDWPTYRHDAGRSGSTKSDVADSIAPLWQVPLHGRLTAPIVAAGRVYIGRTDAHAVEAFDEQTGDRLWTYTTGGRIDSPPTYHQGRLYVGSADGWVYCLRASDGELVWRFRGAPVDRRLMAFEQLESVWPAHGSTLIFNDEVWFVVGRSNFLDGGLRLIRLGVDDGRLISETIIDEKDPETGENIQERLQVLQMPVGLPDILSSDGTRVYMRSQEFDSAGQRQAIGPHSGQAAEQGSVQRGETAHLFAPMGFLDDTWFHRSYWVFGRSFAGGHSGYYQAGKYAPAGRILVADGDKVYGFGREPQYLRWTTVLEHQLFSSDKEPPPEAVAGWSVSDPAARRSGATNMVRFEKSATLDPTNTPLAVEAWVNASGRTGVILAKGGPALGYSLWLNQGRPRFSVRTSAEEVVTATGQRRIVGKWTHLVGVLSEDGTVSLYADGELAGTAKASQLISKDPAQSLEIGADDGGAVADYTSPNAFVGVIDEVRIYRGEFTAADVVKRIAEPEADSEGAQLVLDCSFDQGLANDRSGSHNDGQIDGAQATDGVFGQALQFRGSRGQANQGSFVQHAWNEGLPLFVRGMVKAGKSLFVVGPPDLIDEESTFQRLANRDASVQAELWEQNAALEGERGAILQIISTEDGRQLGELKLDSLPVWDGLAAANGRLFLTTADGQLISFGDPSGGQK